MDKVPPIQTLAEELTLWTLNHTAKGEFRPKGAASIQPRATPWDLPNPKLSPKGAASIALTSGIEAAPLGLDFFLILPRALPWAELKLPPLGRNFWRIVLAKEWLSASQSRFVHEKINEIGRMAGNWMKASAAPGNPEVKRA